MMNQTIKEAREELDKKTLDEICESADPMDRIRAVERLFDIQGELLFERMLKAGYKMLKDGVPTSVKPFPNAPKIPLPSENLPIERPFPDILRTRRSRRSYDPDVPVTLAQLGTLLQLSFGIVADRQGYAFRTIPTTGGFSAGDIYVLAYRVEGLPQGLYHYDPRSHALDQIYKSQIKARALGVWESFPQMNDAALGIAVTADVTRGISKYHARYLRSAYVEIGCLVQNLALVAEGLGLSACPLASFSQRLLAETIGVDNDKEIPIISMSVGKGMANPFYFELPPQETGRS